LNGEASILVSQGEERSPKESPAKHRLENPTVHIRPSRGWSALNLRELWDYRGLLWILIERDVRLLYKQTALGIAWVILQPLIAAVILTVVFGVVARLPSDGEPFLLFVISGMTVWSYFSHSLQRAGNSVVSSAHLVSKVYFPRLLLPLTHIFRALIDFVVVMLVLFVLMAVYHVPPTLRLLTIPLFVFLMMLTATGIALWFSALSVRYRDCANGLPYFLQVWMYATPIVYPISLVPHRLHWLFAFNPAVGFVEGFRWAVFGHPALRLDLLGAAITVSLAVLFSGAFFFRRAERGFADVI
jgi:homopolymeric O-antigen transport system permease protein